MPSYTLPQFQKLRIYTGWRGPKLESEHTCGKHLRMGSKACAQNREAGSGHGKVSFWKEGSQSHFLTLSLTSSSWLVGDSDNTLKRKGSLQRVFSGIEFFMQEALNCHVSRSLCPSGVGHTVLVFLLACFGSGERRG